jgi:hypothetical protein
MRDSELEAIESLEVLADDLRRTSEYGRPFVFGPQAAAGLVDVLNEVAKLARRLPNTGDRADQDPVEGFSERGRRMLGDPSP